MRLPVWHPRSRLSRIARVGPCVCARVKGPVPRRLADVMVLLALTVTPAAMLVYVLIATPPAVLAGACAPALATALFLVWREPTVTRPWILPLAAVVWGALLAALASSLLNDVALSWLADVAGEVRARSVGPNLAAPLIEEAAKAAPLFVLVRASSHDRVRAGVVLGALIGLGFELTENVRYLMLAAVQGGPTGLVRGVWVRSLVGGFDHAVFTASAGAGIGWASVARTARGRSLALAVGLGAAVAQHVVWNVLAAPGITGVLCNAPRPGGSCAEAPTAFGLGIEIPLIAVAELAPGVLTLLVLQRLRDVGAGAS